MRQRGGPSTSSREWPSVSWSMKEWIRPTAGGGVADRGPATIGVPAEDLAGEAQAAHGVGARGKLHAARRHLEDVCPARCIEHVRPLEKARERLAILAVADKSEAGGRCNLACDAAHVAAPAPKRQVLGHACPVMPLITSPHHEFFALI
jgi:hypothetical protein